MPNIKSLHNNVTLLILRCCHIVFVTNNVLIKKVTVEETKFHCLQMLAVALWETDD